MVAKPPEHHHLPRQWGPAMAPAVLTTSSSFVVRHSPPSNLPIDFSPPLIAMVVVAAAAFLIVTYSRLISRRLFPPFHRLHRRYRRWRRRRRLRLRPHFPTSDSESPPALYESSDGFYVYSPYGLDESVIKNIPLSICKLPKSSKSLSSKLGFIEDEFHDCAVCLLEFEDGDYIRTLPVCSHSFHVDCIDIWLKSHATCPLCRSGVLVPPPLPESPLTPLMAARIRPSLDEGLLLESIFLGPLLEGSEQRSGEIQPAGPEDLLSPGRMVQSEDHRSNRSELDFLLKRSYSFGFERTFQSERLVLEPATTPYHHHRYNRRRSFFWTKRPSSTPVRSIAKSRVFSFRQKRGPVKSPPFFRRRFFFPMSESSASLRFGGSSRRMKYTASPVLGRAATTTTLSFSSSRMRCGDPEALISPERYKRR